MSDLAENVAKKTNLPKKQARTVIATTFESIAGGLKKTGRVSISGVGSFVKTVKPAQKGGKKAINPFTGEQYVTKPKPAAVKAKFRPSGNFKKLIGGK
ncbi:MAG TPA: HU family DNA-binding protein [Candidatus Thermoplasmatota archaeon]|nr:HU family DNA-binding protein [Candidatus Thermoplasmatota archaeon]